MLSLDDGMSTLKRGVATMSALIHRIYNLCLQISNWLHRATGLLQPVLRVTLLMDTKKLHIDILTDLISDKTIQTHLSQTSDPKWTTTSDGLLQADNKIYVPDVEDLQL